MSFIIDLNLVCLVCLQDGELQSVFNKDASNISIADKIMKCSELYISEKMRMPDKICSLCVSDLEAAYRFRLNCETAKTVFKSFIKQEVIPEIPSEIKLNDQKIKIPPGLKIKRIHPVQNTLETEDTNELTQQVFDDFQDLDEEENYSTTDYFETAEILEEEVLETFDEIDSQDAVDPVTVKTENQIEEDPKIKLETSNILEPSMRHESKIKRGRGRPRKLNKPNQNQIKNASIGENTITKDLEEFIESKNKTEVEGSLIRYYNPRKKEKSIEVKPSKICDICGNSYKYQHALNSHMRRHRNERPFNCEFCAKAFVSAVELRRHMRVHTGQKPYACQYCDRRFSDFGSRIKHERTHTGERPYICSACGKGFAYAHVLSVHTRTHTGEKKYKCFCGKGFTKKIYLQSHMSHHSSNDNSLITIKHVAIDDCLLADGIDEESFKLKLDPSVDAETIMDEEVDYESIIAR